VVAAMWWSMGVSPVSSSSGWEPCRVATCCTAVERNSLSKPWLGVVAWGSLCSSDEGSKGGDGALMRDHPEEVRLIYPGSGGGRQEVLGVGARSECPRPSRPFAMMVDSLTQYKLSSHSSAYQSLFINSMGSSAQFPWGVYPPT
jgi:hypothetical protein